MAKYHIQYNKTTHTFIILPDRIVEILHISTFYVHVYIYIATHQRKLSVMNTFHSQRSIDSFLSLLPYWMKTHWQLTITFHAYLWNHQILSKNWRILSLSYLCCQYRDLVHTIRWAHNYLPIDDRTQSMCSLTRAAWAPIISAQPRDNPTEKNTNLHQSAKYVYTNMNVHLAWKIGIWLWMK